MENAIFFLRKNIPYTYFVVDQFAVFSLYARISKLFWMSLWHLIIILPFVSNFNLESSETIAIFSGLEPANSLRFSSPEVDILNFQTNALTSSILKFLSGIGYALTAKTNVNLGGFWER